jgi:putative aldouronate transport system substrate-binding protein
MKKGLAILLMLTMLFTASALADGVGPFGHYDDTIHVSVGLVKNTSIANDGITENGNMYADYLLERSNIAVDYAWEVDDANYNSKISMGIASGDLPDIFLVRDEQQLRMLVENGLIEDLTGTYEAKAADYVKAFYSSYGDDAFKTAMYDGKLMAIPDLNYGYQFDFCWVRQDWLDKLGLEKPTTVQECLDVAQAFIDNNMSGNGDTVGFVLKDNVAGTYNSNFAMDPILNTFDAYLRSWVVNDDGTIEYGSVQPQAKTGLKFLADMYKNGLIDKEFAVRSWDDITELMLNGRCGICFAAWYMPDWPLSNAVVVDPKANWVPVLAPLSDDGLIHPMTQQLHKNWLCVRKGYAHPELAWELINYVWQRGEDKRIEEINDFYKEKLADVSVRAPWSLAGSIMVQWNDAVPREGKIVKDAIDKGYDTTGLSAEMAFFTEGARKFLEDKDPTAWKYWGARVLGCLVSSDDSKIATKKIFYPATTDTMALKWANMKTLEDETILKIIMGEAPIDSFDEFVTQWNQMGGTEITQEVNAMYAAK